MKSLLVPALMVAPIAFSQAALPVPDEQIKRTMPNDTREEIDTEYKKLYEQSLQEKDAEAQKFYKELETLQKFKDGAVPPQGSVAPSEANSRPSESRSPATISSELGKVSGNSPEPRKKTRSAPTRESVSGIQVFAVSSEAQSELTVLPAASWIRAKMLTGVQATSQYAYNVLLQLEYAATGPNGSKIPLQGCTVVAGAIADLSIERLILSPHTLSCVRDNGEAYQRRIDGFVAGKDSSYGLAGVYDSKQSKVFLQAVLAGVVKGASEAYEIANSETEVLTGAFGTQSQAKTFKGKFEELAIARGAGGAAEMTTNWYLEQAKALLPSIGAGSGSDVWIVTTNRVDVPDLRANK